MFLPFNKEKQGYVPKYQKNSIVAQISGDGIFCLSETPNSERRENHEKSQKIRRFIR